MHGANNMNFIKYIRWAMPMIFVGIALSQPTVAVLDFDANGIPEYEVETLVERLRSELPNTGAVRLVDRKMLENILKEQGLQQSGCTTDECAAQIGELLGAQYMISGSIGKLENTFTVDMKMVSVSTGAAERARNINFQGGVGGLLIEMQILNFQQQTLHHLLLFQYIQEASSNRFLLQSLQTSLGHLLYRWCHRSSQVSE